MKKRRWLKILLRIFATTVAIAAVGLLVLKSLVVPAVVRWQILSGLEDYWAGQAEVDTVEFNYLGPCYLRGLVLRDEAGRKWLSAESVELRFRNWPGLHPVLRDVYVSGLALTAHFKDGRCSPPILTPEMDRPSWLDEYVDIDSIFMPGALLELVGEDGLKAVSAEWATDINRKNGHFELKLRGILSDGSGELHLTGRLDPCTLDTNAEITVRHSASGPGTAVVFDILGAPHAGIVGGKLFADFVVTGRLDDPQNLNLAGNISLEDLAIMGQDGELARDLHVKIRLDGRKVVVRKAKAAFMNGTVEASGEARILEDWKLAYNGRIWADRLHLAELSRALGSRRKTTGLLTAECVFSGQGAELGALNGKGIVFLDDTEMMRLPVIPHVFSRLGLGKERGRISSDAEAVFSFTGPVVSFQRAQMANRLLALEAEPGGKVNLQKRNIDMYIVTVPLKSITGPLSHLPVINMFAGITEKLSRLHIIGNWDDPPAKLITKEPVKDIAEGTLVFFRDAAGTGGQLGQGLLKVFGSLLEAAETNNLRRRGTDPNHPPR